MIQQTLMYLHNAILLGKYRKNYWYMNNMAISHRCYAEWKKPASKSYTKVPLIWYCRKGKASEHEDEWLLGLRGGWRVTTIWGISVGEGVIELFYIMMGRCLLDSICLLKLRLFSHYCVWLSCDRLDCNHQALLSKGFARQKYLSGLPFPFPGESSWSRDQTHVSCIAGEFFTTEPPGKPKTHSSIHRKWLCL